MSLKSAPSRITASARRPGIAAAGCYRGKRTYRLSKAAEMAAIVTFNRNMPSGSGRRQILTLTPPNLFPERQRSQISQRLDQGHNCIVNRERCDFTEVGGAEARAIERQRRDPDSDTGLIRSRERKRLAVLQIAIGSLGWMRRLASALIANSGIRGVVTFIRYCGRSVGTKRTLCSKRPSARPKAAGAAPNKRNSVEPRRGALPRPKPQSAAGIRIT